MEMRRKLNSLLVPKLRQYYGPLDLAQFPQVSEFVDYLMRPEFEGRQQILAIVFYGSCLNPGMQKATSTPDYYVIVESQRGFYGKRRHALLNNWMPPNIYRFGQSKYSVISLHDLKRETGPQAHDVYNLGRFSKRLAIAYSRDPQTYEAIIDCCANAMIEALLLALPLLKGEVDEEAIIFLALQVSYLGEVRVEAGDKVSKIFQSQRQLYQELFGSILAEASKELPWLEALNQGDGRRRYRISAPQEWVKRSRRFLRLSRVRACLRWPKFAWTVESWQDYVIAKIERTHGVKIKLTPRERRWAFFVAWKYMWRLRKKNLLK